MVTFLTSLASPSGISSIHTQMFMLICCEVVPVTVERGMLPV